MSRKTRIYKHKRVSTSYLSENEVLGKFINCMMYDGKKSVAERILFDCFALIKKDTHLQPMEVFKSAVDNVTPVVHVMSIRIAGSNYQVPMEVPPHKQITLAIRWIIESARNRTEHTMVERLCKELVEASKNTGKSIEKKQTVHKMAEANRAYAHYRW
uniref:Ribosomal protein S7 n=1 Tax=Histiona aroides TaxID=392300 RepID=M4Q9J7_HISAR|nr:ribosomal protein S7 [Histiona aroides]AGH24041.1 ribosomal protein S7 [Histiona aroides]